MGWRCIVRYVEDEENDEVVLEIKAVDSQGNLVYAGDNLEDLFSKLPEYSIVEFWPGRYDVNFATISSENIKLLGRFAYSIEDLPTIRFLELELPQYTMINRLNLMGGRIIHEGKVTIHNSVLEDCKISNIYIYCSRIHNSEIVQGELLNNYAIVEGCIIKHCKLTNVRVCPFTRVVNCSLENTTIP